MTVPDAPRAIESAVQHYGDTVLVGAGTVTDADQAKRCIDAGAQFLVSPGFSTAVVHAARGAGLLAIPGAFTPTELMNCLAEGIRAVKVFPCGSGGGVQHIKALRGPFPNVALIPTGGVNSSNAAQYIAAGAFALGAGSDLVDALLSAKETLQKSPAELKNSLRWSQPPAMPGRDNRNGRILGTYPMEV